MTTESPQKILLASDMDGVLNILPPKWHPQRLLKFGLTPRPDAAETLLYLAKQPGIDARICTSRARIRRRWQTPNQLRKMGFPEDFPLTYSEGPYADKVPWLLKDVALPESQNQEQLKPSEGLTHIVLVDDNVRGIMKGIETIAPDPRYRPMLERFIFVPFGSDGSLAHNETIYEAGARVTPAKNWAAVVNIVEKL